MAISAQELARPRHITAVAGFFVNCLLLLYLPFGFEQHRGIKKSGLAIKAYLEGMTIRRLAGFKRTGYAGMVARYHNAVAMALGALGPDAVSWESTSLIFADASGDQMTLSFTA